MKTVRDNARELMKPFCKVCPICNGKACVGQVPGMGGLGTATSFKNNIKALEQYTFNMRLIHDVVEPDTSVEILGMNLDLPVIAAPIGGVSFNMGGGVTEEQYTRAIIDGCRAKGTIGCVGDGDFVFAVAVGVVPLESFRRRDFFHRQCNAGSGEQGGPTGLAANRRTGDLCVVGPGLVTKGRPRADRLAIDFFPAEGK